MIPNTAANESWKPTSYKHQGFTHNRSNAAKAKAFRASNLVLTDNNKIVDYLLTYGVNENTDAAWADIAFNLTNGTNTSDVEIGKATIEGQKLANVDIASNATSSYKSNASANFGTMTAIESAINISLEDSKSNLEIADGASLKTASGNLGVKSTTTIKENEITSENGDTDAKLTDEQYAYYTKKFLPVDETQLKDFAVTEKSGAYKLGESIGDKLGEFMDYLGGMISSAFFS